MGNSARWCSLSCFRPLLAITKTAVARSCQIVKEAQPPSSTTSTHPMGAVAASDGLDFSQPIASPGKGTQWNRMVDEDQKL